jgi:hypothetical protein
MQALEADRLLPLVLAGLEGDSSWRAGALCPFAHPGSLVAVSSQDSVLSLFQLQVSVVFGCIAGTSEPVR